MIDDALTAHFSTLMQVAGASMKYSRLAESFAASFVLARKRQDVEEMQRSASISAKIVDLLVRHSEFALGEPQRGDRIEMATGRVFEVRSQPNTPCWEWSDPRHTFMRLHCVEQEAIVPVALSISITESRVHLSRFRFAADVTPTTGAAITAMKWTLLDIDSGRKITLSSGASGITITDTVTTALALTPDEVTGTIDSFYFAVDSVRPLNPLGYLFPPTMKAKLEVTDSSGATAEVFNDILVN